MSSRKRILMSLNIFQRGKRFGMLNSFFVAILCAVALFAVAGEARAAAVTMTHTSDGDFNAGTFSNTVVSGTGINASVKLQPTFPMGTNFASVGIDFAEDVYVDTANNKMYVADGQIEIMDSGTGGTTLGANSTYYYHSGVYPNSVYIDTSHNKIFGADRNNRIVVTMDSGTGGTTLGGNYSTFQITGGTYSYGTRGITADTVHNRIFVADTFNNRIIAMDSGTGGTTLGANLTILAVTYTPTDLYADSSDNKLYTLNYDYGNIVVMDSGTGGTTLGSSIYNSPSGQFNDPVGFYLDKTHNRIFVSDTWSDRIAEIASGTGGTTLGETFSTFGTSGSGSGQFDQPIGMYVDATNHKVFVVDSGNSRVAQFDSSVHSGSEYLSSPGIYTSSVIDAGISTTWQSLTATADTPANTSIVFETRSGDTSTPGETWSVWQTANPNIVSPAERYLQYRATLSTSNTAATPIIYSLSIAYNEPDGEKQYYIDSWSNQMHKVFTDDFSDWRVFNLFTDTNQTISGANGAAVNPGTNEVYAILTLQSPNGRYLTNIDMETGEATVIGNLGDNFSGLAFDQNGVLYGLTGDGANVPATLYEINKATAGKTLLASYEVNSDGETLAFNFENNLLYRATGSDLFSIDPDDPTNPTAVLTNSPALSVSDGVSSQALMHRSGTDYYYANNWGDVYAIDVSDESATLITSLVNGTKSLFAWPHDISPSVTAPTVTTGAVSAIADTTATGNGNITATGGENPTRYIEWGTVQGGPYPNSCNASTGSTGSYSCSMTSLTAGTTYYVRAKATNSANTSYGSEVSFETTPSVTAPTVTTGAVSAIADTTATGNGNITATGGENPTRYIEWGTVQGGPYPNSCNASTGSTGSYSCSMTSLTAGTTYYVRAKATNSADTSYGSEVSFETTGGGGGLPDSITIIDPDATKISAAYTAGYLGYNAGSLSSTNEATTNVNLTLQSGNGSVTIPTGTAITKIGGGNFDLSSFMTQDVTASVRSSGVSNSHGAVRLGVPFIGISFSTPITISITIGSQYNGRSMAVQYQNEGESNWNSLTTCTIASGRCTFTTDHATRYTVNGDGTISGAEDIEINLDLNAGIEVDCSEDTSGIIDSDHVSHEDGLATLGAITEDGQSALTTNSQTCKVRTNETHGYSLALKGSGTDATNLAATDDATHTITPISNGATPGAWSVANTASGWGYHLASTSESYDADDWSTDDYDGNWAGVTGADVTVGSYANHTANTGNSETFIFGAEIGTQKIQPTGTYTGQVTVTATTL